MATLMVMSLLPIGTFNMGTFFPILQAVMGTPGYNEDMHIKL
jgi:hypothetical protein